MTLIRINKSKQSYILILKVLIIIKVLIINSTRVSQELVQKLKQKPNLTELDSAYTINY